MTPHPAQFLAGKRIIVAGGSFAALYFVLALDQLWNPSLDRPEVIIDEKNERENCLEKDPYVGLGGVDLSPYFHEGRDGFL
ncbi:hypothetical protein N7449_004908 [Penicillium cf. viridicatum]|uniref:Uncharacterized protein n=1 Tax=Penicillium cf. viridicatum TaxID=2972119 RepID=A0A9W9MK51_9EURO|nr:hypothetical protein N7449_004908 [Penicillium cf. viridicatum]